MIQIRTPEVTMAKKSRRWNQITTIHHFRTLKSIRVFGIARVSTDKQAKYGESLEHQRETILNWIKSKATINAPQEWKLVELYVENEGPDGAKRGRTATKREGRRGLAKALELAKGRLIDVVVVTKLDRIARNVKDYIDISNELNESQTALVCLDLDIDTSTPDGQMIMRNHANLAQWQAERIAQYSMETARRHARQGRPLGLFPIGYRAVKDESGKHTWEPDPIYKKHLQMIDKLYLTHQSVDRVVQELHKKGFKTPRGKTYCKPQIARILQNIRYTGRQGHDGEILEGNWPPIRTQSLQEKILKIITRNRKHRHSLNRMTNKYVYLLQGLLKCHRCHSSMAPKSGTGKSGRHYPYYLCVKADKTEGIDCEEIYLPAETVDKAVIGFLRKLRLEPSVIEKVVSKANEATSSRMGLLQKDLDQVRERLRETRTKISHLVDILAEKGVAQLEALRGRLEKLDQEEKDFLIEEKRLDQEIRAEKAQAGAAHHQIQSLHLFNDLFLLNKNRPERIKAILPRFVSYVVCHITDKKRGIGRFDIGLFGRPFTGGGNAEVWNEALRELARHSDKALNRSRNGKSRPKNIGEPSSPVPSARISSELGISCGTKCLGFAGEYQKG